MCEREREGGGERRTEGEREKGSERERGGEREREGRSERAREGGSERGERQAGRFRKCERGQGVGSGSVKYGPHEESTKC